MKWYCVLFATEWYSPCMDTLPFVYACIVDEHLSCCHFRGAKAFCLLVPAFLVPGVLSCILSLHFHFLSSRPALGAFLLISDYYVHLWFSTPNTVTSAFPLYILSCISTNVCLFGVCVCICWVHTRESGVNQWTKLRALPLWELQILAELTFWNCDLKTYTYIRISATLIFPALGHKSYSVDSQ